MGLGWEWGQGNISTEHGGAQHGAGGQKCPAVPAGSVQLILPPRHPQHGFTWTPTLAGTPGVSDGCHPLVAVLGILGPQLQRLLVLVVEVNGEVMLWGERRGYGHTPHWVHKALLTHHRLGYRKQTGLGTPGAQTRGAALSTAGPVERGNLLGKTWLQENPNPPDTPNPPDALNPLKARALRTPSAGEGPEEQGC